MDISTWSKALNHTFSQLLDYIAQNLPNMIGAVSLILFGLVMARILRSLFIRLLRTFDKLLHRFSKNEKAEKKKITITSANLLGNFVFWIVILFFVTAAINLLKWKIVSEWLNKVIQYLPSLLVGGVIVLSGYIISSLLKDIVTSGVLLPAKQKIYVGKVIQSVVMVTFVLIGLGQIGIDVTFLVILFSIIIASIMASFALAISLGAKTVVSNIISAHYFKQSYRVGQTLRVGDYQGKIIDLTPISVVLETSEGVMTFPAKVMQELPTLLIVENQNHVE